MSMLRFVLRKINVMHNSLIKFWSVRNSNKGASLFQNIAQTKAKLQLNEAGRISTINICLIILCALLFGIIFFICVLWLNWPPGWSIVVSILPAIVTKIIRYKMRWEYVNSINYYLNGAQEEAQLGCRNTSKAKSSTVVQEILDYCNNYSPIKLYGNNSNCDIVNEISIDIDKKTAIDYNRYIVKDNFIIVKFDYSVSIRFDV